MSECMPTTEAIRDALAFAYAYGLGGLPACDEDDIPHEVVSGWLAEVERAAAEKALRGAALSGRFGTNAQSVLLELADSARAWNQGYLAASRDFMQNAPFENAAANPYRRNEGENE